MDWLNWDPKWFKRALTFAFVAAVIAAFVYAFSPDPVPVDTVTVERGELRITIDEEGKTRIKDIFVVSAPTTGRVLRSALEEGDIVEKGKTPVVSIEPSPPPFLDIRARRELLAQIKAARASVDLAKAEVKQARAELSFAELDLNRARALSMKQVVSARVLEKAAIDVETRQASVAKAEANQVLRERELESAQARLIGPRDEAPRRTGPDCCVTLKAPVSGRVLKLHKESEQIVPEGTPLLEIGDPDALEIVVELLSAEAVRVPVGARALVTAWGGDELIATVKRIEPAGFTKVSALGIEEQRVRVLLEFDAPSAKVAAERMGHDFRVFVKIIIHDLEDKLVVPLGALFRQGGDWAVYVVDGDTATLRTVDLGLRNAVSAAVNSGLAPGDRIVMHASDRVANGVRVTNREDAS